MSSAKNAVTIAIGKLIKNLRQLSADDNNSSHLSHLKVFLKVLKLTIGKCRLPQ